MDAGWQDPQAAGVAHRDRRVGCDADVDDRIPELVVVYMVV
jgi:hypothetical protein